MAFSWNPFSRRQKQEQYTQNISSNLVDKNQNYGIFKHVNNDIDIAVATRSIIGKQVTEQQPLANPIWQTLGVDSDMLLMPIATNKAERIAQYRKIAKFTECDWCLDEICDEFIHEDENGQFIHLDLPDRKDLNATRRKILQEQFDHYINLFRLRDDGYNLIKRFLIEGELAWENIIKTDCPDIGIIGVRFLEPEYYETLLDTKTNRPAGLLFDTENYAKDIKEILSNNYMGSASIFNAVVPTTASFNYNVKTCVPMLWSQLTYINSGETSINGNQYINYPLIEKSKQAYYQLALLQDAAVILRVTRAPERLLFNVSTGRMPQNYAEEMVRNFANSLKSKKVMSNGNNGNKDISQVYNPVSMLESYVFGKNADSEGTTIESVGSNANYEEMGDIEYFLRRFMKQFKVPFSRYKTPENAPPSPDQLSYEEHSFMKMIVRFQRRFADGFKKGYITHLKLKGLWDKYELSDEDIKLKFTPPSLFELYEVQQTVETKMNIYKTVADEDLLSKISCMKKYLGFTDDEVKENFQNLMKEKMLAELGEYYSGQIAEKHGLAGWEPPIKFVDDVKAEQKTDDSNEDGETNDESAGDQEDQSEEQNNDTKDNNEDSNKQTFGLK